MTNLPYLIVTTDGKVKNRAASMPQATAIAKRWYPHSAVYDMNTGDLTAVGNKTNGKDMVLIRAAVNGWDVEKLSI